MIRRRYQKRFDRLTFRAVKGENVLVTFSNTGVCDNDIDASIGAGVDSVLEHGHLGIPGSDVAFDERMAGGRPLRSPSFM